MLNQIINQSEFKESSKALEYMNDFGAIYKDRIIIHSAAEMIPIQIKDISKIEFVKDRQLLLNFSFIIFSIIFVLIIAVNQLYFFSQLMIESIAIILAFVGFLYTKYKYKFSVVTNFERIELLVQDSMKQDAEELVRVFNQRF